MPARPQPSTQLSSDTLESSCWASHSSPGSDDTQSCSATSNHLQETATGQSGTTWHRHEHWAQGFRHNTIQALAGQTSLCDCWQGRNAPNVDSAMWLVLASPGLPEPPEGVLECTYSTGSQHAEGSSLGRWASRQDTARSPAHLLKRQDSLYQDMPSSNPGDSLHNSWAAALCPK